MTEDPSDGSHRRTTETPRDSSPPQPDPSYAGTSVAAAATSERTTTGISGIRPGEIVALRAWRLRDGEKLFSVFFSDYEWFPDPFKPAEGDVENTTLQGVHAFKHDHDLKSYLNDRHWWCYTECDDAYVWGTVELWGSVWEHEYGYRAQYARVKTIDGAECEVLAKNAEGDWIRKTITIDLGPVRKRYGI